mgnify:CR=1 FL=1
MSDLFFVLSLISGLFVGLLILKSLIKREFCVICASVSLSWLTLFWSVDPLLIGIMMGQSAIGLYYLLNAKLSETFKIFRFPYIISAIFVIYVLLSPEKADLKSIYFVASIWLLFLLIAFTKRHGKLVKSLIECCKNW